MAAAYNECWEGASAEIKQYVSDALIWLRARGVRTKSVALDVPAVFFSPSGVCGRWW